MESIKGWKFLNENDAKAARQICNNYYGFPKPWDNVTLNWCDYSTDGEIWFIRYDESIEVVLGEPQEFMVG